MVGADTPNFEVSSFEKGSGMFDAHQVLPAFHGIHVLENMNTAALVSDEAWEILFTLGLHASPVPSRPSSTPSPSEGSGEAYEHRRCAGPRPGATTRVNSAYSLTDPVPAQRSGGRTQ